ncbi:AsnC family transcriptional regulator [Sphaerisporangium sp. TRM90804]|uniref:Lrp/AsnC family transcriptional regulator n=1 Tax=Sphaerisporangium sp. TRM90804 TaxID=3031113 RepID=UPI002449BFBE|nr:AsnC family transcriptional regulator [Sphaerisporangium sp. TRM90804]MDH2425825.1 AsnC family transcriptional regulator [Sphaerisporangium sp. TRM90804]
MDRRIINALQIAPRAPFARIAPVLGVSEQTVARRYQRLRSSGVIRVLARPEPIRQPGSKYWTLRIGCRPGTAGALADALAGRDDTSWISIGAGGAEITCLTTVAEDDRAGLLDRLPRASNVLTFSAHQMLHRFPGRGEKDWIAADDPLDDDQRAAIEENPGITTVDAGRSARLEPSDGPLLEALARDGRASWSALAEATGWSERQVAQRVAALLSAAAISFYLDIADAAVGIHSVANLWFTVAPADLAVVGAQVADHAEVAFAAAVTGPTNLMASVRCRDATALYRYLTTKVAAVNGVRTVETVPLLTRLKQSHFLIENGQVREPPRPA